ncbi:hypothetical protein J3459_013998 [Metarhizium acridum]|nr:hypothetical protein J3459_013998 [Metarhizium acridum]
MTSLTSRPSPTLRPTCNGVHTGLEQITLRDLLKPKSTLCLFRRKDSCCVTNCVQLVARARARPEDVPVVCRRHAIVPERAVLWFGWLLARVPPRGRPRPEWGAAKKQTAQSVISDGSDRLIMYLVCGMANTCGGRRLRPEKSPSLLCAFVSQAVVDE